MNASGLPLNPDRPLHWHKTVDNVNFTIKCPSWNYSSDLKLTADFCGDVALPVFRWFRTIPVPDRKLHSTTATSNYRYLLISEATCVSMQTHRSFIEASQPVSVALC